MNVRRLRRVQKFLLEEPLRFTMRDGLKVIDLRILGKSEWKKKLGIFSIPSCGTACCIGGAAFILKNGFPKYSESWFSHVLPESKDFLGLTEPQTNRLFYIKRMHSSAE